jgi:predicted ATPase
MARNMAPRRIVFAGGPGGGKTTVLRALAQAGHAVVADSARSIIRDRKACGLSPRPAPIAFAQAILRHDLQQYREHASSSGLVFFERGIVDALAMLHEAEPLAEHDLQAYLSACPYDRRAFFFPPWESIYELDDERDQTFADAERIYALTSGWYRRCGYDVVEVPKASVAQRCAYVLRALGRAS